MADKPAASASASFDKNKQVLSSSAPRQPSYPSSSTAVTSSASSFPASQSSIFAPMHRLSNSSHPSNSHFMDQPHVSMAPPPPPSIPSVESKKSNIPSLMSPPDAVLDSFHQGYSAVRRSSRGNDSEQQTGSHQQQPLPMSPPVSPYTKPITAANALSTTLSTVASQIVKDPVLYPGDEQSPSSPSAQPLFAPAERQHHKRIVDEHVRTRPRSIFGGVSPPERDDYELVLTFRSQVMKHFTANPKGWLLKTRAHLEADRRASAQRYHKIVPAKPVAGTKSSKQRADRVSKPQAASRPMRTNATTNGATRTSRPAGRASATPEPSRRVVAPNREDKDFNSIPDYCPPLDILPDRPNSMKVEWKGPPIDLSNDHYAHLLHPDELLLAANLRLDCATYLTSKRRIFERRVQCLHQKKEFRKTDAQQACKIDVNKASKLWVAFDKVGWLDARLFSQYS
ncbi:hypothetical protein E4U55_001867 [Claviceps digitariae]|nr:hypothetical protein E4U55_001867 [Claviceps digitariae]